MAPDRGHVQKNNSGPSQAPYEDAEGPDIADESLPLSQSLDYGKINARAAAQRVLAARAADPTNFTARGILLGLLIGVFICFSNVYFGLQTGWISGMSMPSVLMSFGFFRAISPYLKVPFTPVENILVVSVASSMGAMPLGCGFVGVIPALEYLLKPEENGPLRLTLGMLCVWGVGISLFGVVFAVPLRKQVIIKEKLKFPTGTATALLIGVLHGKSEGSELVKQDNHGSSHDGGADRTSQDSSSRLQQASQAELLEALAPDPAKKTSLDWRGKIKLLIYAFIGSAFYTVLTYFIPHVRNVPIFGTGLANMWLWTLNPSPAYVGQGIIMGPATTLHMLLGAILGWGILSPLAKRNGWAPGPVSNWETGAKGWIVWISLAIMLADALVSLGWLVLEPLIHYGRRYLPQLWRHASNSEWRQLLHQLVPYPQAEGYSAVSTTDSTTAGFQPHSSRNSYDETMSVATNNEEDEPELDAPPQHLITTRGFFFWLLVSIVLYFVSIHITFPRIISFAFSFLALLMALLLSVMGVRALGSTDLNPVSGISKLTQLIFSVIVPVSNPNAILINLLAGAISEAGAIQAGDMMSDLKSGHLLGASPRAQFYGQLIAGLFGAVVSACIYRLYTHVYTIPDATFQMPTAFVWIFTARLVTGSGLPEKAADAAGIAAAVFAVSTIARTYAQARGKKWLSYIPGGIAVAVGMYNTPSFTLARAIGGLISAYWVKWRGKSDEGVVVLASGLILGEGLFSIVNLALQAAGVPHL